MSLKIVFLCLALPNVSVMAGTNSVELKKGSELCSIFNEMQAAQKESDATRKISIKLGKEILTADLSLTMKGNGTIQIANLNLRVFDIHDDGILYKNHCLNVRFKEPSVETPGLLEVTGIVLKTEDDSDKALEEQIDLKYAFIQKMQKFEKTSKTGPDFIELR